jgi:glycosyltransferase involved in cell wall biosynthesis
MNVGGPAVLLAELIKALPADKFEHTLITGRCLENEIDFFNETIPEFKVVYIDEISRSISIFREIVSFYKLVKIIKGINPDIVHTHTSKAGVLGRLSTLFLGRSIKVIHTYHGHLIYGYFSKVFSILILLIEKLLSRITDLLIAVSLQVKSDLQKQGVGVLSKWEIIHPGIPEPKSFNQIDMKQKFGLDVEAKVVAWVGRFTQIKNPLLAIESMNLINVDPKIKLQLVMAGDGELLPEIKSRALTCNYEVIFLGWTNNISELFAASDLLLMTSRNEGMPVVIIEAAFQGVPTISTSVGGVSEFIENGHNGILCTQNPEEIASHLAEILSNTPLANSLGKFALAKARDLFSISYYLDRHVLVYENLFRS